MQRIGYMDWPLVGRPHVRSLPAQPNTEECSRLPLPQGENRRGGYGLINRQYHRIAAAEYGTGKKGWVLNILGPQPGYRILFVRHFTVQDSTVCAQDVSTVVFLLYFFQGAVLVSGVSSLQCPFLVDLRTIFRNIVQLQIFGHQMTFFRTALI